jgi:hypothetical protein
MPTDPASDRSPRSLGEAIAETLAYADVFDYPLTTEQICRYLVRTPATPAEVEAALLADPWLAARVERHGELICLRGRSQVIALRQTRERFSASLWRTARALAAALAYLPFVRMVAIIGSLSMDNVRSATDDIDVLIVTAPGRVWLARALVIGLVRLAALARVDLCPNYVLSTRRLNMTMDDLFTAHELTQMMPLFGSQSFTDLLAANSWLESFLPNAAPQMELVRDLGVVGRGVQRLAEWPLRGRLGDVMESGLRDRKMANLRQEALASGSLEAVLDAEECKGHMGAHAGAIRAAFDRRRSAALTLRDGERRVDAV